MSVKKKKKDNSTSTISSTEQNDSNYLSKKLDNHQTNIKPKQHYLFPKTPNNDDKKNFEFNDKEKSIVQESK